MNRVISVLAGLSAIIVLNSLGCALFIENNHTPRRPKSITCNSTVQKKGNVTIELRVFDWKSCVKGSPSWPELQSIGFNPYEVCETLFNNRQIILVGLILKNDTKHILHTPVAFDSLGPIVVTPKYHIRPVPASLVWSPIPGYNNFDRNQEYILPKSNATYWLVFRLPKALVVNEQSFIIGLYDIVVALDAAGVPTLKTSFEFPCGFGLNLSPVNADKPNYDTAHSKVNHNPSPNRVRFQQIPTKKQKKGGPQKETVNTDKLFDNRIDCSGLCNRFALFFQWRTMLPISHTCLKRCSQKDKTFIKCAVLANSREKAKSCIANSE